MIAQPVFDIGALADKLGEVKDEEDEAERKKREFEEKRKNHYKSEFKMAQLLKQRQMEEDEDEED